MPTAVALYPRACSGTSTPGWGPGTPWLRELDAYAELVERLRAELLREREEKESSAQCLQTLRSSYKLLLQRVEGGDVEWKRRLALTRRSEGEGSVPAREQLGFQMPSSSAVH